MDQDNGRSFNCAESVILIVNKTLEIPGLVPTCMRVASVFGGGIAGGQEVCGAVSGAAMCLGLALGTNGDEPENEFELKRNRARQTTSVFRSKFVKAWGTTICAHLRAMDTGVAEPMGNQRGSPPVVRNHCGDYVYWASDEIVEILSTQD